MTEADASTSGNARLCSHGDRRRLAALLGLCALLPVAGMWSVSVGPTTVPVRAMIEAVFSFDGSREHLVVVMIRLPRVVAGLLVGAALAVAGAIMQAITNNPLASPSLLGINAGAAFAVVVAISILGTGAHHTFVWAAFSGAAISAVLVLLVGSIGPARRAPVKLILAGAVLTAFLTSLTTAILIFDRSALDSVRLWTAGSLTGRSMAEVRAVAPYILAGFAAALVFPRQLAVLRLGSDVSRSLGQSPALWRGLAAGIVILLAGGAVALAGPIGFVGLVVPHVVRLTAGADYRWLLPFAAAGGALLVLTADTLSRILFASQSFPVGVTMAIVGAPFFIWLARTRLRETS